MSFNEEYVSGITTYTIIETTDTEFVVSYPIGVGISWTRSINRTGDVEIDQDCLNSHLISINHKVKAGSISTTGITT